MHALYVHYGTFQNAYYTSSRLGKHPSSGACISVRTLLINGLHTLNACTLKALSNVPCRHDIRTRCIGITDVDMLTAFLGLLSHNGSGNFCVPVCCQHRLVFTLFF